MDDKLCPLRHEQHVPNAHICFKSRSGTHGHLHVCDEHAEAVRQFVGIPKGLSDTAESIAAHKRSWTEVDLRVPITEPRLPECQEES